MKKFLVKTIICFSLISSFNVNAYLDPGTGSLIIQGIIGGIAVGLATVKLYWYRLKALFGKNQAKRALDDEELKVDDE